MSVSSQLKSGKRVAMRWQTNNMERQYKMHEEASALSVCGCVCQTSALNVSAAETPAATVLTTTRLLTTTAAVPWLQRQGLTKFYLHTHPAASKTLKFTVGLGCIDRLAEHTYTAANTLTLRGIQLATKAF